MRYLVLTDIHANLEALDTALADAHARGYDRTLVLGDLVGYGADPNAVIERVRSLNPAAIVRGNHDKVACGLEQAEGFNAVARSAARWTLDVLIPEYRQWLAALPEGPIEVDDTVEICHGSPRGRSACSATRTTRSPSSCPRSRSTASGRRRAAARSSRSNRARST